MYYTEPVFTKRRFFLFVTMFSHVCQKYTFYTIKSSITLAYKMQLRVVNRLHFIKRNLFLPYYSWSIAHLDWKTNHSLTLNYYPFWHYIFLISEWGNNGDTYTLDRMDIFCGFVSWYSCWTVALVSFYWTERYQWTHSENSTNEMIVLKSSDLSWSRNSTSYKWLKSVAIYGHKNIRATVPHISPDIVVQLD